MKRFSFRLQRVLDYRNTLKKESERELALKNQHLLSEEERLAIINEAIDNAPTPQEEVLTMAELALNGAYLQGLRDALVHQRLLVIDAQEAVERARDAYIEKAIEAKTLDVLKDRRLEEYREDKRRYERKEIDKLVVQRHRLNKGG